MNFKTIAREKLSETSYVASHYCLMFDQLFSTSAVHLFLRNNKETMHRDH